MDTPGQMDWSIFSCLFFDIDFKLRCYPMELTYTLATFHVPILNWSRRKAILLCKKPNFSPHMNFPSRGKWPKFFRTPLRMIFQLQWNSLTSAARNITTTLFCPNTKHFETWISRKTSLKKLYLQIYGDGAIFENSTNSHASLFCDVTMAKLIGTNKLASSPPPPCHGVTVISSQ